MYNLCDCIYAFLCILANAVGNPVYDGIYTPPSEYKWLHPTPPRPAAPRIYEVCCYTAGAHEFVCI